MKTKEKIWKFIDDKYKSLEEFESLRPETVLKYYGEKLIEDTNKLLNFDIEIEIISHEKFPILLETRFFITVSNSPKSYRSLLFRINYYINNIYPCNFYSLWTKNEYICSSKESLIEKIEEEIKNKKLSNYLGNLLYHFYDEETIKKLK